MSVLQRDTERYIKDLHINASGGNVEFSDAYYSEIEKKIKNTSKGDNRVSGLAKMALQVIAQFGIKKLIQAVLNENKTSDQRLSEIKTFLQKANEGDIFYKGSYDEFRSFIKKYHVNFFNSWEVFYGNNKQIKNSFIYNLMSAYTRSITFPTIEISTEPSPLPYTKNEDIQHIDYGEVSFTILIDSDLLIWKNLMNIIQKIKNPKTGRYGYREDYRFDYIEVWIQKQNNANSFFYKFEDCIIKSISSLNLNNDRIGTLQEVTFTIIYDRLSINED